MIPGDGPLTPKAVIFDCDGVLVDSEGISAQILIESLAMAGVEVTVGFVLQNCVGRSFSTVRSIVETRFDTVLPEDFEQTYRKSLLEAFERDLQATSGLAEVLAQLNVPICVATSSSPIRVAHSLKLTGLAPFFGSHVYSAAQVKNGKPAPDLFLFAAKQLGIAPQDCLVIEDSVPGIDAARAAGMDVFRYEGGAHLRNATNPPQPRPLARSFQDWSNFFDIAPSLRPDAA